MRSSPARRSALPAPRDGGYVLLAALVFMAIFMLVSSALISQTTEYARTERVDVARAQALAIAEGGIDRAVSALNQNGGYAGETDTALGGGEFTTTVTTISSSVKHVSTTAWVPDAADPIATRTVSANVSVNSSSVSFRYGVQVGDGGVVMGNGAYIYGSLYSNGSVSGGGIITGDAIVATDSSSTPDQIWTLQNTGFDLGDITAHVALAQSFKPSETGALTRVSLNLKKTGDPSDITIEIVADNKGKPSSTVLASGTLPASLVTSSYGIATASLTSSPTLTANTSYWIIAVAPVSSSNYFTWGEDTWFGYPNGSAAYSSNWQKGPWSSISGDLDFVTYMSGQPTSLSGVWVEGNAYAHTLSSCIVDGNAYYQSTSGCWIMGSSYPNSPDQPPGQMPISDAQIAQWEQTAAGGGVIQGPYSIGNTQTIGPEEINGDLTVGNGATLILSGPVWVTGNFTLSNNATLSVASALGDNGTVLVAGGASSSATEGVVTLANNVTIQGNGNPDSHPMILSTNSGSNAISLSNNASSVILYAPYGTVSVSNGAQASEVTAYQLSINNQASVNYTQGLQNASFANGPGGSWAVVPGTYAITQ